LENLVFQFRRDDFKKFRLESQADCDPRLIMAAARRLRLVFFYGGWH
jgi:hypothetical protein